MDRINELWERRLARLGRASAIAAALLGGVCVIEINRLFELPDLLEKLPTNHLVAIAWAVTVLLIFEIIDMVLSLSRSVAASVGRHLQVYALLLLRDAFGKLAALPEPIEVTSSQYRTLGVMGADAIGAILLFAGSTWFARLQPHTPIVEDESAAKRFIALKKLIAFSLLIALLWLLLRDVVFTLMGDGVHELFDHFFTILIFVDVLLAIISLGFSNKPPVVFRNFGFAFAAILLRLAVASPDFMRPGLGVAGAAVAIAVTFAYKWAIDEAENGDPFTRHADSE